MSEYISMREYAELHGIPLETVKARVKRNQIEYIRFGKSVKIERNALWEERKKTGRKTKEDKERSKIEALVKSKILKVKITHAYYISVEDASGKEITSDFTFLSKAEAVKIGEKMKREVEGRR